MLQEDCVKVRASNYLIQFPMQQQKIQVELFPLLYPAKVRTLKQGTIEINQTPADHRHNSRKAAQSSGVASSSSQTRMQEVLTNVIGTHRIIPQYPLTDCQFDTNRLSTGNFDLVKIQWQGGFKLEQEAIQNRYTIYIALAGSLDQKIDSLSQTQSEGHQSFCCSIDTATIVSPGQKLESIASDTGEALLISIDLKSIESAAGKLFDRSLKQPVVFIPSIDLTHELGLSLKKFTQFLWEAAAQKNLADFSSIVLRQLEKAFLSCLVEGVLNNYSEELRYQQDGALACHVRKAQAFIESHLQEEIDLGDIAAATGVCARLLQKAFSQHCGCSPMRFVTHTRLERIRQVLETATSDLKIVDVMMNYGFTQGGKFANEYQQLFGEKPSETLKRSIQLNRQHSPLWQSIDDAQSDRVVGGAWYHQILFSKYPKSEFFHFY
jgi:AraC-like DNA-binding protein